MLDPDTHRVEDELSTSIATNLLQRSLSGSKPPCKPRHTTLDEPHAWLEGYGNAPSTVATPSSYAGNLCLIDSRNITDCD